LESTLFVSLISTIRFLDSEVDGRKVDLLERENKEEQVGELF